MSTLPWNGDLAKERARVKDALRQVRLVCTICRDMKAACSGYPCQRCFRLSLPCRPQPPRPRPLPSPSSKRPRKAASSSSAAVTSSTCHNSSRHASPSPPAAPAAAMEEGKEAGRSNQGVRVLQPLQISYMDLILARRDPRCLSATYLTAFENLLREGGNEGMDRTRVIQSMRVWQHWSALVGGDVTWGMADKVARLMHILPLDLEDAASISLGPARTRRKGKAQEELAILAARAEEVRATDEYLLLVQAADEATAMFLGVVEGDRLIQVGNAAFDRLVEGGGEMMGRAFVHRTTILLLLGQLVAPDDRPAFFEGFMQAVYMLGRREKATSFIKLFDGDGEIRLYIVSFRRVSVGQRYGVQILLERAPNSKYLTAQPHRNQIIDTFRVVSSPTVSASASASASSSSGLVPPFSSPPLSLTQPFPRLLPVRARQMGEAWGLAPGNSQQDAWREATALGAAGAEAETSTTGRGGEGRGGGGGGAGDGRGRGAVGDRIEGGQGAMAQGFSLSGLACLSRADSLTTEDGQMQGLLAGAAEKQYVFTTRPKPGAVSRASSQDWRVHEEKAKGGKLKRMEGLRLEREEERSASSRSATAMSSTGSLRNAAATTPTATSIESIDVGQGLVEGGEDEFDAVLASVVGAALEEDEMSKLFYW